MRLFELENANVIAARKAFIVQVGLTSISLSLSQAARMWNVHTELFSSASGPPSLPVRFPAKCLF